jgi:FkbM family methyltransferase
MNIRRTIAKVAPQSVIRGGRYIVDQNYRRKMSEISRLESLPRYEPTVVNFMEHPLAISSAPSFLDMYDEIFEREIYKFRTTHSTPYIIDGGANIGLSVIYFKRMFPNSHIVAFEADPDIFALLENNLRNWGYDDVELFCCALWSDDTTLRFQSEGSYAGRLSMENEPEGRLVPAVRLNKFLNRPVSLLKLDIEGAETDVLKDCADLLINAENVFVEYHSFPNAPQTLDQVLKILASAGLRVHLHTHSQSPQPFVARKFAYGMDMQVNIFAYR